MSDRIPAIYNSGVFRPLQPVELAEGTPANVIPLSLPGASSSNSAEPLAWPANYFEQTAGSLADEEFI